MLRELERIDDEADDLDVMFVKIKDMRYAKKYGITTIPTLVFFRKRFPSVYRGELRLPCCVSVCTRNREHRFSASLPLFPPLILATILLQNTTKRIQTKMQTKSTPKLRTNSLLNPLNAPTD